MNSSYASQVNIGTDVYGSDDDKIGSVADIGPNYFIVEKGFLFTTDIYVPMTAIASATEDRIYLNVAKDQVDQQGWDEPPAEPSAMEPMGPGTMAGGMAGGMGEPLGAELGTEPLGTQPVAAGVGREPGMAGEPLGSEPGATGGMGTTGTTGTTMGAETMGGEPLETEPMAEQIRREDAETS
jgi:hypothetical protein